MYRPRFRGISDEYKKRVRDRTSEMSQMWEDYLDSEAEITPGQLALMQEDYLALEGPSGRELLKRLQRGEPLRRDVRELLEPHYGDEKQPKFGDGDIVEILKEMKSDDWDITTLPQYVTYEHYMWKEYNLLKNELNLTHLDTLKYMQSDGWDITLLQRPPSWSIPAMA